MTIDMVSPSQVSTFFLCPEQWRRIYLEGERIPPGIAAHVGTGVHKAAETNHTQKIITGADLPVGDITDAARDAYDRRLGRDGVYLTREEAATKGRLLGEGKDRAVRMARVYHGEIAPRIQPAAVEERLVVEPDDTDGVMVQGYLDCTTTAGEVVDLKTSGQKWSAARIEEQIQPTVYSRLYEARYGRPPERFRYEIVVGTKTLEYRQDDAFLVTKRDASDWAAFASRVRVMARMVKAGIFPPATPGIWKCSPRWCGFFSTCPYQARRVIVAMTAA